MVRVVSRPDGTLGRYEEGYTELKRATRLDPHPIVNQSLGFVLFFAGRYDQAIEQFEKALELDPGLAQAHCVLGLTYEALRWLETGYRERAGLMVCLKTDQRFDELRSDQRFQDLLRRMNFPA